MYKFEKNLKEASYYHKLADSVRCDLCPNHCILKPGDTGICHTRTNIDNTLFTLAYGNPNAMNTDPIEKKPLYHFLPGSKAFSIATAGCNLSCLNCQNQDISQVGPLNTHNYDLMPVKVVEEALKSSSKSIAYTYSEPVVFYEYAYDTAVLAKEKGIKNILITNGYISEMPLRELCKFTDAANVNLKSFSEDIYKRLNGGKLKPILRTLKIMKEENIWLEITNLIVPGWTDNLDMIKVMCDWLYDNNFDSSPLHFSRFYPTYMLTQLTETPVTVLEKAMKIALNAGIKYVYIGNVYGHSAENTFCHNCKKMIIQRNGFAITTNNIINNSCKYCSTEIPGIWK
jgi:pyruvate formate lyase activating enzyme